MTNPIYTVVTFGASGIPRRSWTRHLKTAIDDCDAAMGSGTCTLARVYECKTVAQAITADVSCVRDCERIVYTA